jgi:tRNA pseudouridine38-40 synthase
MARMIAAAGSDIVRLRIDLAYDGTDFSGWARQPDRRTVQQTIEDGLARVLRVPEVALTVAGRTDAGVHARGQVCHVDLDGDVAKQWPPDQLGRRLARLLPDDIVIQQVTATTTDFDARFSAFARRYSYRIDDDGGKRDPLRRREVLWHPRRLDTDAMQEAAAELVGEHDFIAFCKPREGATTIRSLIELTCRREGPEIECRIVADAFCHHMVRALIGALTVVGEGRKPASWPGEVLRAGVRDSQVPVMPAHGLTLEAVDYPDDARLASQASAARVLRTLR